MTYLKQMQQIVSDYRAADQPWPATAREIAAWAIREGKWDMPAAAVEKKCAEDIADAMRELYFVDKSGRRVRAMHAATVRHQGVLFAEWDDIRTASRKHMQLSFQQHRKAIVGECRQLKTALDSYNEAHPEETPLQISFDFNMDLAEFEAAREAEAA
jgi:hypothetical protein